MTARTAKRPRKRNTGAVAPRHAATRPDRAIEIPAGMTVDQLIDKLNQQGAGEVILEVAPESTLLLSVQDADRVEAVAADCDQRIVVASASSRRLNAALVFGWPTIDRRVDLGHASVGQPAARTNYSDDASEAWQQVERDESGPPAGGTAGGTSALQLTAQEDDRPRDWVAGAAPGSDELTAAYGDAFDDRQVARTIRPLRTVWPIRGVAPILIDEAGSAAGVDSTLALEPPAERAAEPWRPRLVRAPQTGNGFEALRAWLMSTRRAAIRVAPAPVHPPIERVKRPVFVEPPDDTDDEYDATPPRAPEVAAATSAPPFVGNGHTPDHALSQTAADAHESWAPAAAPDQCRAASRRASWRPWLGVVAVLVATLAIGAVVIYDFVATATVTLVARTSTIAVAFNVVVAEVDPNTPQGAPTKERIVAPARRLMAPIEASATVPASGVRYVPVVTAGGPVVLSNASTGPVFVPQGAALSAEDGRVFLTLDAATVPPADPYDAAKFGTVEVRVAASLPGAAGNAPVGAVRGRLPSGIYYNNRDAPVAGGADRAIAVVTSSDLAAARAAAEQLASAQGAAAIAAVLPPGYEILPGTTGVGDVRATYSAPEGSDGESVGATVNATATALTFNPDGVTASARNEVERRLAAAAPASDALIPGSAQTSAPVLVSDAPGVRTFAVEGSARTRTKLGGDGERARLQQALANRDDRAARALLATLPGVSSVTVEYGPSWVPRRMPWRASKIDVQFVEPAR